MHTCQRISGRTAIVFLLAAPAVWAQDNSARSDAPQGMSKSVIEAQVSSRSASAPLEMRVSVQYLNSRTAEVLEVLAKAAGLTVELPSATLAPVTITLTNVRLRTALDAICDTASCTWRLEGKTIKVSSAAAATSAELPPTVSIQLDGVSVPDVFRAIGAAINVQVRLEGHSERSPVTVKFTNSNTTTVLDFLCKNAGCSWDFDAPARQLRVTFKAP